MSLNQITDKENDNKQIPTSCHLDDIDSNIKMLSKYYFKPDQIKEALLYTDNDPQKALILLLRGEDVYTLNATKLQLINKIQAEATKLLQTPISNISTYLKQIDETTFTVKP